MVRGGEFVIATTVHEVIQPGTRESMPTRSDIIMIVVISADLREIRHATITQNLSVFDPELPQTTIAIPEALEVIYYTIPGAFPQLHWREYYFNLIPFDGQDEITRSYMRHAMSEYVRIVEILARDPTYSALSDRAARTAQAARVIIESWDSRAPSANSGSCPLP